MYYLLHIIKLIVHMCLHYLLEKFFHYAVCPFLTQLMWLCSVTNVSTVHQVLHDLKQCSLNTCMCIYQGATITLYPIGRPVRAIITLYPIGRPVRATITLYPIGRPVRAIITPYPIGRPVRATITLYPIGRPVRPTITLYPIGRPVRAIITP